MRRDHLLLHKALKQFSLKKIIPHPDGMPPNRGTIVEWRPGDKLELPVHQINAYRAGESEPAFQVFLAESSDGEWIFRRNPKVRMPISKMGFHPLWGLPYLAPEIVLLFKAKHLEARFERAARRGKARAADKAQYWELYTTFYRNLIEMPADHLPHTFVEAFAAAYREASKKPPTS